MFVTLRATYHGVWETGLQSYGTNWMGVNEVRQEAHVWIIAVGSIHTRKRRKTFYDYFLSHNVTRQDGSTI